MRFDQFKIKKTLGKGRFGKVVLAEFNNALYAIKYIKKDAQNTNAEEIQKHVQQEAKVVTKMTEVDRNHPFLIGFEYVFQTNTRTLLVMPFAGADIWKILLKEPTRRFTEESVRFLSA